MAIVLDTTASSITTGFNGTITKTWTHVCTGSNLLLVVTAGLWQDTAGTGTISAASYNSVALTKAVQNAEVSMDAEIWYLIAPASGSHTVSVTVTGDTDAIKLASSSFTGVVQTSALDTTSKTSGTSGNPQSSEIGLANANELLITALSRFSTTNATPTTSGMVNLFNDHATSTLFSADYSIPATSGLVGQAYTGTAAQDWSLVQAAFIPASGGGTPSNLFFAML